MRSTSIVLRRPGARPAALAWTVSVTLAPAASDPLAGLACSQASPGVALQLIELAPVLRRVSVVEVVPPGSRLKFQPLRLETSMASGTVADSSAPMV